MHFLIDDTVINMFTLLYGNRNVAVLQMQIASKFILRDADRISQSFTIKIICFVTSIVEYCHTYWFVRCTLSIRML